MHIRIICVSLFVNYRQLGVCLQLLKLLYCEGLGSLSVYWGIPLRVPTATELSELETCVCSEREALPLLQGRLAGFDPASVAADLLESAASLPLLPLFLCASFNTT